VILDGKQRTELSEYLGHATNQVAELEAILRGLQAVKDRTRAVVVYSDSAYSIGLLTAVPAWKAKKNVELVAELRELVRAFPNLRFVKVPGHAGVPLNERCDQLARDAITRGR
jgi:ribonuclease HI